MFATLQQFHELMMIGSFDHAKGSVRLMSLNQVPPFGDVGTNSQFGDGDNWDSPSIGENGPDSLIHPYE